MGYGVILTLNLCSTIALAAMSYLLSRGVHSNDVEAGLRARYTSGSAASIGVPDNSGGGGEPASVATRTGANSLERMRVNLADLPSAVAATLFGAALLYAGLHGGGESLSAHLVGTAKHWSWRTAALETRPFLAGLASAVVMTCGTTVLNIALCKQVQSALSLCLALNSYVQARTVQGAELRDAARLTATPPPEVVPGAVASGGAPDEAVDAALIRRAHGLLIEQDARDVFTASMVAAIGAAVVLIGACFGGDSVQEVFASRFANTHVI